MNIFRVLGDMSNLAARLLLVEKLHASESAAGVSLKTQQLYLLVFLARYADLLFIFISLYNSVMKVTYIGLAATTIGMMRYRPSLRATYDVSLDNFRMWMHAIVPSFVLAVVIFLWGNMFRDSFNFSDFLWDFSQVLEPLAVVPQLIVFRGCAEAGRLAWMFVSLLVAYRALYVLNWVYRAYTEAWYIHPVLFYVSTAVHLGMCIVFMVDRKCRVSRPLSRDEINNMMEPNSAAREPLLEDQAGTDEYAGDDSSGSFEVSGGGDATSSNVGPLRGQRQGGEVENRIEGVLMRERGQGQSSSPPGSGSGGSGGRGGIATDTGPVDGMAGGRGGVFLV